MQIDANSSSKVAFTQYEPIGVVAAVSAFNHPFNLICPPSGTRSGDWMPSLSQTGSQHPAELLHLSRDLEGGGVT